ncbi:MAG: exo-alpha-sialidase [Methanobacteriota archaeon]|nr:MAG: exo-alpha-sialidase [Euryarchaeota archaeon]
MSERASRAIVGVAIAALMLLLVSPSVVRAADLPPVSITYSVTPGGYNNTVRVGNVTDMLYPRIAVDRGPTSPYRGTIYVLGMDATVLTGCRPIVVARSTDGGRTFEAPRKADVLCAPGPALSVAVDRAGAVYAAGWGPVVARSSDRGVSWSVVATLGNASAPASLAVDPVTNTIQVVWGPLDDPWRATLGPLVGSFSRDGGGTWTVPADLFPNGTTGARPQAAAVSDAVVVGFQTDVASVRRLAAIASPDGGRTWGNLTLVDRPDPCGRRPEPSVAASPGGLFAISWAAETGAPGCSATWGNSTETWAAVSSDAGRTFSAPVKVGGPPAWIGPGFGGGVAFDDASSLFVAWRSIAANWTGTVYAANSADLMTFESAFGEPRCGPQRDRVLGVDRPRSVPRTGQPRHRDLRAIPRGRGLGRPGGEGGPWVGSD